MPALSSDAALLVLAVAAVGVLHTCVPDHWAPITLIARQRGWSRGQAARVAAGAGVGHTLSTLAIALIVWIAGVALAARVGHWLSFLSSLALIAFGGWIAIGAILDLRREDAHARAHAIDEHTHAHDADDDHGPGHARGHGGERTALMLVLGSSPMIEGIPAFFAAARFGVAQLLLMAAVFAAATIATYVGLVVASLAGFERLSLGPFERYGEVLSGAFVAALGLFFLFSPL